MQTTLLKMKLKALTTETGASHQRCSKSYYSTVLLLWVAVLTTPTFAATYDVGPGQPYATVNSVPALNAGDLVQIHSGTYHESVRFQRGGVSGNPVVIRGVGATKPVFDGTGLTIDGVLPNARAIFQVEASYITIDNVEFIHATNGNNGAGIRVHGPSTIVGDVITHCKITYCEMGMMSDTCDQLLIDSSEIAFNGTAAFSGYSHNFYLNGNKTTVQYCYIHDSLYGQNFKTRGHYTELLYNTIANSEDGDVMFVDDATLTTSANSNAVMIGNIVIGKVRGANWNHIRFVSFGQDGGNAHNGTLYAINNTFYTLDSRNTIVMTNATGSSAYLENNICVGSNSITSGTFSGTNNWIPNTAAAPLGLSGTVTGADPSLANPGARDFHLVAGSGCIDTGAFPGNYVDGAGVTHSGAPLNEYVVDFGSATRTSSGNIDIGAYEYHPAGTAPTITSNPANQTVTAGQTATFTVAATGTATLTYQWQKNGANIGSATATSYTTPATTTADSGATFRCVVTNSVGSATSAAATLTVNAAPVAPSITSNPANQTVTAGQTATFTVAATGTATLSYQWQKNGANIASATGTSYTTPATTTADSGSTFRCVVTNSVGSATSAAATLTVNAAPVAPSITSNPANQTVTAGQTATFTVAATGTATLTYQWQKNGANIASATGTSYTTPATTTADSGSTFRCVVTNSVGSATSTAATLTVNAAPVAPTITSNPANQTVTVGQTATFTVAASGTATLNYQWQKNATNIASATGTSYTTPATTTADSGSTFRCVVTNSVGSATSTAATLTVNAANSPPVITSAASATPTAATTGQSVAFAVAASDPNFDTLSYAWAFGDGATATGGSVTHAYAAAGTYTATATVSDGKGGTATSSVSVVVTAPVTSTVAINSGGKATGAFAADKNFSAGNTYTSSSAITTTGVYNPAPQAVYQSERYGNFTYTIPNLTAGAGYTVRLHFAEIWWNAAGQRVFNVAINGQPVLTNFDIFAASGGKFIAIVKAFAATASSSGQITITYTTVKDNAKSSGIEVLSGTANVRAVAAADLSSAATDVSGTVISNIDLGSVKLGQPVKINLDSPESGLTAKELSWGLGNKTKLASGISLRAGVIAGKPRVPGVFTFDLTIKSKTKGAVTSVTNTYTLTVEP